MHHSKGARRFIRPFLYRLSSCRTAQRAACWSTAPNPLQQVCHLVKIFGTWHLQILRDTENPWEETDSTELLPFCALSLLSSSTSYLVHASLTPILLQSLGMEEWLHHPGCPSPFTLTVFSNPRHYVYKDLWISARLGNSSMFWNYCS